MNLSIRFTEIYQRTGKVIESYPVGPEFAPTVLKSERYGLVLSWPREYQFLSVAVKPTGTGSAGAGPAFVDGLPGLDKVFGEYKLDYAAKVPDALRKTRKFASGFLTRGSSLTLEFAIDTDDEDFCDWASQWVRTQTDDARARPQGGPARR